MYKGLHFLVHNIFKLKLTMHKIINVGSKKYYIEYNPIKVSEVKNIMAFVILNKSWKHLLRHADGIVLCVD